MKDHIHGDVSEDERLRDIYKRIRFEICPDNENWINWDPDFNPKFQKSVSFNTVPSTLGVSAYETTFEGLKLPMLSEFMQMDGKNDLDLWNNHLSINSYNNVDKLFHITPDGKIVRKDYPSRPTIVNDAMIINKHYLNWATNWQHYKSNLQVRIQDKDNIFKYPDILFPQQKIKPIMMNDDYVPLTKDQRKKMKIINMKIPSEKSPRTIVCHINGRKHTWVALDWILTIGLHDLDHLVILTNLPRVKSRFMTDDENSITTGQKNWGDSLVYDQLQILEKCFDLLQYVNVLLSSPSNDTSKSVKITIDIVIGKTKKCFIDAINIYNPDLIMSSTLKWERNAKLIERRSPFLKDKLCFNFPLPVCIIPVKRLYQFELNLQSMVNNQDHVDPSTINNNNLDNNKIEPPQIDWVPAETTSLSSPFRPSPSSISPLSSVSSIDSFTADYNTELTTFSDNNVASGGKDKDSMCKKKDQDLNQNNSFIKDKEQFLKDIEDLPIVSQLYIIAKQCRRSMQDQLTEIENSKHSLNKSNYLIERTDCVLNYSLQGSLLINNIKGNKLSEDVDLKGFARLKRVITGGEPTYFKTTRPMTDVVNNNISHHRRTSSSNYTYASTPSSPKSPSQITFASGVKIQDGNKALGNSKGFKTKQPMSPTITISDDTQSLSSNDGIKSLLSVDSDRSSKSIKSDNFLYPKRLMPTNNQKKKKNISAPSSRRNSNSDEKPLVITPIGKRKMIAKLFGFK